MQTAYVSPETEIVRFESEDVISTSCLNDTRPLNPDDDGD